MKISRIDIAIIAVVLLFSFIGYASAVRTSSSKNVVIEVGGSIFGEYGTDTAQTVEVGGNAVEITADYVKMVHADCPDRLCVRQGKISKGGQVIVCLPNKIIVRIQNAEYDAVSS